MHLDVARVANRALTRNFISTRATLGAGAYARGARRSMPTP